jgi:hypothetical protein
MRAIYIYSLPSCHQCLLMSLSASLSDFLSCPRRLLQPRAWHACLGACQPRAWRAYAQELREHSTLTFHVCVCV